MKTLKVNVEMILKNSLLHNFYYIFIQFAAHVMNTQSYYGVQATSDMYDARVDKDEMSGVFVQLYNQGNGRSNHNAITIGWHVSIIDTNLFDCSLRLYI